MKIVECEFCEKEKAKHRGDLVTASADAKHCQHCHETYENYIEHCRDCEKFRAYALATTGRELLKPNRKTKEN